MTDDTKLILVDQIEPLIHEIRGQKVILDYDLARLYGVETRLLNQAVRRNPDRFPADFLFQLTSDETAALRSQFVILKKSGRGQHRKFQPNAFTEHGATKGEEGRRKGEMRAKSDFDFTLHSSPFTLPKGGEE